jgi:hypothetical protein
MSKKERAKDRARDEGTSGTVTLFRVLLVITFILIPTVVLWQTNWNLLFLLYAIIGETVFLGILWVMNSYYTRKSGIQYIPLDKRGRRRKKKQRDSL